MKKLNRFERFIKNWERYTKKYPYWYTSWISLLAALIAISYEASH